MFHEDLGVLRGYFKEEPDVHVSGLSRGLLSPSHLMKVASSSKSCLLVHERPGASLLGSLNHGEFV